MTSWMYCMITKKKPNNAKKKTVIVADPVAKSGLRNNRTSSRGWRRRISTNPKATASTTPALIAAETSGGLHPRAGASSTPNTKTATAPAINPAPGQSSGVASSSREDDTVQANTKISAAKTANAQKIDRQDQKCNSVPDPSMPMTAPQPATPAQMPTALARSSSR